MKKYFIVVTLLIAGLNSQTAQAGICKYSDLKSDDIKQAEMAFSGKVIATSRGSRHTTKQIIKVLGSIKNAEEGTEVTVYLKQDLNRKAKVTNKPVFVVLGKKQTIEGVNDAVNVAPLCNGSVHYPITSKNAQAVKKYTISDK